MKVGSQSLVAVSQKANATLASYSIFIYLFVGGNTENKNKSDPL